MPAGPSVATRLAGQCPSEPTCEDLNLGCSLLGTPQDKGLVRSGRLAVEWVTGTEPVTSRLGT